jgi:ornithine carbamoyltransferase
MTATRHFLALTDLTGDELRDIIQRAITLKALHRDRQPHASLPGRTLAMIFEKASTRTRVSFEAGMAQLGGHAMFLSPHWIRSWDAASRLRTAPGLSHRWSTW